MKNKAGVAEHHNQAYQSVQQYLKYWIWHGCYNTFLFKSTLEKISSKLL